MKRVITTERLTSCDLASVQVALTRMIGAVRMACNGRDFGGASTIHIEDEDGWTVTGVSLIEESLSDGSKVYNAQLLFGELSEPLNKLANATGRVIRKRNSRITSQSKRGATLQPKPNVSDAADVFARGQALLAKWKAEDQCQSKY